MGFGDFLFGGTDKLKPSDIRSPQQIASFNTLTEESGKKAADFLRTAGDPFPSGLVNPTDPTAFQKDLFAQIPGLFSQGDFTKNPLFQQSVDVLSRTAEGFDPFKDKRLIAFQDQLKNELKNAKDRIAARTSAQDRFTSSGRLAEEGQVEEQGLRDIGSLAAQLENQSRQQAIAAASQLPNLASLMQNAPLEFLQQGLQFGDIPRQFDENTRIAQLNDLLRQRGELASTVGPALQTSSFSPPLAFDVFSSTPGLLGGPSGISNQPGGGVNRNVQIAQASLGALAGGMGGGGLGGAVGGGLGASGGGQNQQLVQLLQQLLGGSGGLGGQGF
jgi:hypothetical protein